MSDAINWTPTTIKLSALQPWERNPKTITKGHAQRLLRNWKSLGQWQTLAIGPNGEVYDGHQRLSTLLAAYGGDYEVKALQSSRPLTDRERGQIVFEGTAGAVGQIDWDVAAGFDAAVLKDWGMDTETLADWKRNTAALDNFLKSEQAEPVDAEPQVDRAAELNEKWQVKTGDLWQIGEHRLLCGDSTDAVMVSRLMQSDKADAQISDPPFMVRSDDWDSFKSDADFVDFTATWLGVGKMYCDVIVAFMADKTTPQLREAAAIAQVPYRRALIWQKPAGSQFAGASLDGFWYDFEIIQVFGVPSFKPSKDTRMAVLSHRTVTNQEHGAEKPVGLLVDLVEGYSRNGGIVLDLFGGTGSVLLACANAGRVCRIVERQEKFVAVQLERMATAFPGIEIKRLESGA